MAKKIKPESDESEVPAVKYVEVNSGPFKKLLFIGHADADAYDAQAGRGECVTTADLSDIYRGLLPEAQEKFAPTITKLTGITRGVDTKATEAARQRAKDPTKVEDVPEKFVPYVNRVRQTLLTADGTDEGKAAGKKLWDEIDAAFHALTKDMACDSSPSARQRGPDKGALAKADDILSRSDDAIETAVTKLSSVVENFSLERDETGKPERESLARLVQEYVKMSL